MDKNNINKQIRGKVNSKITENNAIEPNNLNKIIFLSNIYIKFL